jgi:antirestriction protein ArdC
MSALSQNFAVPIWMTYRQAGELNAHVRKGEKGSLVVYANATTRTEHDDKTGEDVEHEILYLKGYTVFNVEQIEGLPEIYYAKAVPTVDPCRALTMRSSSSGVWAPRLNTAGVAHTTRKS